jgi:hypothetical protein
MANRKVVSSDRAGRLARLEAENARLRRLAAELAADVDDPLSGRSGRRRDGAVDPAHRLLVGAPPRE